MRRLSWIITLPVALVVVVFALANRQAVEIKLWPFGLTLDLPIFIVVLLSALAGFFIGAMIMWFAAGKYRKRARRANYRITELEQDLRNLERRHAKLKAGTEVMGNAQAKASGTALRTLGSGQERPAA